MRKIAYIFFALAILVSEVTAQQEEGTATRPRRARRMWVISGGGGVAFPIMPSEFKNYYKMGYTVGGDVGYAITPALSIMITFDYTSLGFDLDGVLKDLGVQMIPGLTVSGADATILQASVAEKFRFIASSSSASPYLLASVGYFRLSVSDVTAKYQSLQMTVPGTTESAFGAFGALGVDLPIGPMAFVFVQGGFAIGFTKGQSTGTLPVKAGVGVKL
jgi:outer membrane protein W